MSKFSATESLESIEKYISTYRDQLGWADYSEKMFANDLLYAIGLSVDDELFSFVDGFARFRSCIGKYGFDRKNMRQKIPVMNAEYLGIQPVAGGS